MALEEKILRKKRCIGYCLITLGGVGFFDIGWGCISGFEAICVSVVCAMLVWLGIVYSKLSLTIIIDGYRLEQTINYLVTYHILPCVRKIEIWLQRIFNFGEGVDPQEVVRARLRIIVIFIPAALYCVAKIILYLIHHINSRFSIQDDWGYLIMLLIISFFVMCGIIVFCKKYISSVRHYAKIANAGAFKLTSKETFKNKILRFENKITAPMIMHENISLVLTALIIYILIPCFFISYTYCEFFKPNSDVLTALKICVTIVSFALAIYSMVYTALARKESNDNMRLQQFILRQNSQHERFKPTT